MVSGRLPGRVAPYAGEKTRPHRGRPPAAARGPRATHRQTTRPHRLRRGRHRGRGQARRRNSRARRGDPRPHARPQRRARAHQIPQSRRAANRGAGHLAARRNRLCPARARGRRAGIHHETGGVRQSARRRARGLARRDFPERANARACPKAAARPSRHCP